MKTLIVAMAMAFGSSLAIAAEVADWRRFASARHFMGFVGLTPSEYSSGDTTRRGRMREKRQEAVRVHCWLAPPLQVYCSMSPPSAVEAPVTSRHLPNARTVPSAAIVQLWAPVPLQVYSWTAVPLAVPE